MAKRWRSAVVGVNTVGKTHVRVLSQLPNTELVAVCDLHPDRARAALAWAGVPPSAVRVYADQAEMHARERLDVVQVATPSGHHLPPALLAMEAGADVVVEKPVEIRLDRIDALLARAAALGRRVAYVSQNRWNDAHLALKQAADEGRFGRIAWAGCFTPWYRPDAYYADVDWRGTWALDGGGAVMNQSIHAIDLLQWICGPVTRVAAFAGSRIHPAIEAEDTASAALTFASGAFGTIVGSTAMYPGSAVRLEIGGEHGTAVSENGLKTFRFRDERPADADLVARVNAAAAGQSRGARDNADIAAQLHARNIADILGAWEAGHDPQTSGAEGRKSVAIVLALYESVRRGGGAVDVT
jgi:UDP-N-acetyl-2-amino-2-deoxyglucuronate dehydrogenase